MSGIESRHVLICGHRAFAARGLRNLLAAQGHRVSEFSRGPQERSGISFSGPATELHCNPHLAAGYDTVVNFIALKHESVVRNLEYCESLWRMCRERKVRHLIHISSMSLYQDSVRLVTEHAPVKTDYCRCGTNAAAKVAAEQFLRSHAGPDLKLSFVRPAWIVGAGLIDPVGSAAWRLASGRLLILGDAHRQRPLIGRSVLHRAVSRLVAAAPGEDSEVLLLVDRDSPAQLEYLQGCCDLRAGGARAIACGSPVWMVLLLLRELHGGSAVTMRTWCRALSTIRQRRIRQRYDPSWTEARLAMSLATRWREELAGVEAD